MEVQNISFFFHYLVFGRMDESAEKSREIFFGKLRKMLREGRKRNDLREGVLTTKMNIIFCITNKSMEYFFIKQLFRKKIRFRNVREKS